MRAELERKIFELKRQDAIAKEKKKKKIVEMMSQAAMFCLCSLSRFIKICLCYGCLMISVVIHCSPLLLK